MLWNTGIFLQLCLKLGNLTEKICGHQVRNWSTAQTCGVLQRNDARESKGIISLFNPVQCVDSTIYMQMDCCTLNDRELMR